MTAVTLIFSMLFALILLFLVTGEHHRSVVALFGALLTVVFGLEYGLLHLQNLWSELVSFEDIDVLMLVIGVMILAEGVARTGFFEFIGLSLVRAVGKSFRSLSLILILLTILFSSLLSNITSMIIMGALTVSLLRKLRVEPTQLVLYEALATNVGGLMLMVSSVPNLVVASEFNIGFLEFAEVALPLAFILSVASIPLILRQIGTEPLLEGLPAESSIEVDPWSVIRDKKAFYRASALFFCVIILFVLEDFIKVPLGLIAVGGATAMLLLGGHRPEPIFSSVDWGTVFFLASFYIIVGGLERSGVIAVFADMAIKVLGLYPMAGPALNVWICGLPSSVLDNIPMTLTLIPVVRRVSESTGFSLMKLIWGIVFGANLGGNLTPIGSPAGIIALGILRREGRSVSWGEWFNLCAPVTLLQLLLASVYVTVLSVIP